MRKALTVLAALGLVLAITGGAFAAKGLLTGADIKNGSLTGADIATHSVGAGVFTASARASLAGRGARGKTGTNGVAGIAGLVGATGATGANGTNGTNGSAGATGASGANGTVTPTVATGSVTAIPSGAAFVTVATLTVPAGRYTVLAKTQVSQATAGDSVDCVLKAVAATIDSSSMKFGPINAAETLPLQAVVTTVGAATALTVQCNAEAGAGSATNSSLIAIPTS